MLGRGCRIAVLVLACALAGSVTAAHAQEKVQVTEYELKGAYLYKFTQYIDWPKSDRDESFVIGVLGKDPFGDILDQIARERKIKGKPVIIRRFDSADDYKPCHILFIAAEGTNGGKNESPLERLEAVKKKIKGAPPLLVGDSEGLAEKGAVFNFYPEGKGYRFEVNHEAAKRADLKLDVRLIKMGKIVSEKKD
jgi:hypothetical protein